MKNINFIDTKFLAINGDLTNTVSGGTAMLYNDVIEDTSKVHIKAKIPTVKNETLSVEVMNNHLLVSASIQSVSQSGVVFNMPFASKAFRIPEGVTYSKIKAYEKEGYLHIEMPISKTRIRRNMRNIDINFDEEF